MSCSWILIVRVLHWTRRSNSGLLCCSTAGQLFVMAKLTGIEDLEKKLHLWTLKEDKKLCELLESYKAEIIEGVDDIEEKLCAVATSVKELSSYVDNVAARIATSSQTQFLQQAVADEEKQDSIIEIKEKKTQNMDTAECIARAITRGLEDVLASSRDIEALSSLPAYIGAPVQRSEESKKRPDEQSLASGDMEVAVGPNPKPSVSTQEGTVRPSSSVTNSDIKRASFNEDIFDSSLPLSVESTTHIVPGSGDIPNPGMSDLHDGEKPLKSSGSVEHVIFSADEISNRAKSLKPVARAAQEGSAKPSTLSKSEGIAKPYSSSIFNQTIESVPSSKNIVPPPHASEGVLTSSRSLFGSESMAVSSISEEEDGTSSTIIEQIFKSSNSSVLERHTKPTLSPSVDFIGEIPSKSALERASPKTAKRSPAEETEASVSCMREDVSGSSTSATFSNTVNMSSDLQSSAAGISGETRHHTTDRAASSALTSQPSIFKDYQKAENLSARQPTRRTQKTPLPVSSTERLLSAQVAEKYKSIFADEDDEDDLFNIKPEKQPVEVAKAKTLPSKLPSSNFAKLLGEKLARGPVQPHESKPADPIVSKPLATSAGAADSVIVKVTNNIAGSENGSDSYSPLPSLAKNRTRGPNRKPPSNRRPNVVSSGDKNESLVKAETKEAPVKEEEEKHAGIQSATMSKSVPNTTTRSMSESARTTASESDVLKSAPLTNSESSARRSAPEATSDSAVPKKALQTASGSTVLKSTPTKASESNVPKNASKTVLTPKQTAAEEKRTVANEVAEKQRKSLQTHETKQRSAVKSFFDADSDDGEEDVSVPSKTVDQSAKTRTTSTTKHSASLTKSASKITAKSLFSDDDDSDLSIFRKK